MKHLFNLLPLLSLLPVSLSVRAQDGESLYIEWAGANPELGELYEKRKHTVTSVEKKRWRHSPKFSHVPENYTEVANPSYARVYQGHVKFGHEKAVKELMKEFKDAWATAEISYPFNTYWNVYGEEGPRVVYRSVYKDVEDWAAEQKEVKEKIGEAKLNDLMTGWNEHIREWKSIESFPQPDLTHIKTQPLVTAND